MTRLRVLNVGPLEWFSPHFAYDDDCFIVDHYDPFRSATSLCDCCTAFRPDILYIFRGDLVRQELAHLACVYRLEHSTEIFPSNPFSNRLSQNLATRKFVHCLAGIVDFRNIYHYDSSRKGFFDAMGIDMNFAPLGVDMWCFGKAVPRDIDVLFFGRASARRMEILAPLKEIGLRFVWLEHGFLWPELAALIARSKTVLNFAAEEIDNFEPRILLGLAGGCRVITEKSIGLANFLRQRPAIAGQLTIVEPAPDNIVAALEAQPPFAQADMGKAARLQFLSSNAFVRRAILLA